MYGHPLQLGVTVLAIMFMCALGGHITDSNPTAAAYLFFAALFIFAFGVATPTVMNHNRYRRYRGGGY